VDSSRSLAGKRVAIIGLGASGVAAAGLCTRRGAKVVGVDQKRRDELSEEARVFETVEQGASLEGFDLVVVSPGVPSFPALERIKAPIWGEIELAFQCRTHADPVIAVGGTNGKSTVTSLVAALLEAAGQRVFAGGNLGEPWAAHADERFDAVVLEVSSFQMERVDAFRPDVAVLLNVTDDHLDRYATLDDYAHAKGNCFVRQNEGDLAVVPHDDALCLREARRGRARVITFGPGGDVIVDANALHLPGAHNALNAAAAVAAVKPFNVPEETVARVLATFEGLPHRMVPVAMIGGVRYYDDSKGTNVGAAATAVLGVAEDKVVLIAGGRDKHGSYGPLAEAMKKKGRAAVLIGEAAARIEDALASIVPVAHAKSMEAAVKMSKALAQPGDAVLLSPACSSFDMFRDYKHRGDEFVSAVKALEGP
jgi:UDP-N-acetylmuramoylalanine--D-glutamate ligase